MPVSSYAAELLLFYRESAKREVTITLATNTKAIALRARLHNLRREMRREKHIETTLANGVQISVRANKVVGYPADQSYLKAIGAAIAIGAEGETTDDIAIPDPVADKEAIGKADVDNVLNELFNTEEEK